MGTDAFDIRYKNLKEQLQNTVNDEVESNCYAGLANFCLLLRAFKQSAGSPEWSARLVNDAGEPLLGTHEQSVLEEQFASAANWLLPLLQAPARNSKPAKKTLRGGGGPGALPTLNPSAGSLVTSLSEPTAVDLSLDKMFHAFLKKSEEMDELFSRIAYESPGFAKILNTDIPPTPITPFPVPAKPVIQLVILFLDSIRLSYALAGQKSMALTLLILVEELVTGQWRQMILTAAGLLSPSGVAAGVIGKYIVNAWVLINPDIRTDILTDLFRGGKSMLIGFLLWAATTFPPAVLRMQAQLVLDRITGSVKQLQEKVKGLEDQASQALAPFGMRVSLSELDLDRITTLSLTDIQNLQALATWDLLVCSAEFQDIAGSVIKEEPILSLALELLGVPTQPEDTFKLCGAGPPKSVVVLAAEQASPKILPAVGGSRTATQSLNHNTRKAMKKLQKLRRKTPKARRLA